MLSNLFGWLKARLGLVTFTVLEFLALVLWEPRAATLLGVGILVVGLFLEHIVAFNNFQGEKSFLKLFVPRQGFKLFGLSASEAVVWAVWLMVALAGMPVVAFGILFAGIFLQHNAELNVFLGRKAFSKLLNPRVALFTLIESASGAIWLALIQQGRPALAATVLALGLLTEHHEQGEVLADEAAV